MEVGKLFLILLVVGLAEARVVSRDEVTELVDDYFDYRLRENPEYAADYGIPRYQDKVQEWNYEAFNRRITKTREYQVRVRELLREKFEDRTDYVEMKILDHTLQTFLNGIPYMNYTVTLNFDLVDLKRDLDRSPVDTEEKLSFWYRKVINYQSVFEDQIVLLNEGIRSGLTPAKISAQAILDKYKPLLGNSDDEFFAFKPWKDLDIEITNTTFYDMGLTECREMRTRMIRFVDELETGYIPACRKEPGLSSLPGGAAVYENTLKYYTSEETTPESAHKQGLREVERITTAMKRIVEGEGFDGTIKEFVDAMYEDPTETFPTSAAVLEGYKVMLNDRIRPKLTEEFYPEPKIGLSIKDDPAGSLGRYMSPKLVNGEWVNGTFLYDGSKPSELLKVTMLALMVHEGVPGHHYQTSHTLVRKSLRDYRKYTEFSHMAQGGFNYNSYSVFSEGWALYSEYLSDQLGIIENDREKLGALSMESLRAARLVVDTGLHYYNWTMESAVEYLLNNTLLSNDTCWGQIIRYVRWPGQACSYKIGELKIKEIRSKAMDKLGGNFNPKEFHKAILDVGRGPLSVLEEEMDEWIDSRTPEVSGANQILVPGVAVIVTWLLIVF